MNGRQRFPDERGEVGFYWRTGKISSSPLRKHSRGESGFLFYSVLFLREFPFLVSLLPPPYGLSSIFEKVQPFGWTFSAVLDRLKRLTAVTAIRFSMILTLFLYNTPFTGGHNDAGRHGHNHRIARCVTSVTDFRSSGRIIMPASIIRSNVVLTGFAFIISLAGTGGFVRTCGFATCNPFIAFLTAASACATASRLLPAIL